MTLWLSENIGSILICLILAVIVALIIFFMVRKRKKGESACGCGGDCSHCHSGCSHSSL